MKKIISVISIVLVIFSIFNFSAFAVETIDETTGVIMTEEVVEQAEGIYNNTNNNARATGLIEQNTLTLSETSTQLIIYAETKGSTEVSKCGFTYIKLQILDNGVWTDCAGYCYEDLYSNSNTYTFSKTISPAKGEIYRVICEHYAEKKTLLVFSSDETIYNVTNSLYF